MTTTALKPAPITGIAAAVAIAVVMAGVSALPVISQIAGASLHRGAQFVASLTVGSFSPTAACAVAGVLFFAGVVSGLSGFAFAAVAATVLWLLPPGQAVPLIMLLSACNQLLSLGALRREMVIRGTAEREGALPYIVGGLAGVPIGLVLLRGLPTNLFTAALGVFLTVYSSAMLAKPENLRLGLSGWKAAVVVGVLGGMLGGVAALPALIPVAYLGLRGVGKSETRGIIQPYILTLQVVSLGMLAFTDTALFNAQFWLLSALTLPAVLFGSATGVVLYRRISDVNFRRAVLILLVLSGAGLVAKTMI
jgi:uncharacterized protein